MGRPLVLSVGCILECLAGLGALLSALAIGLLSSIGGALTGTGWIDVIGGGYSSVLFALEGFACFAGAYGLWTGKKWGRLIITGLAILNIIGVYYVFTTGGVDYITPITEGIILAYLWLSKGVKEFLDH